MTDVFKEADFDTFYNSHHIFTFDKTSDTPTIMVSEHTTKDADMAQQPRADSGLQDYTFNKSDHEVEKQKVNPQLATMGNIRPPIPPTSSTIELGKHMGTRLIAKIEDGDAEKFAQMTISKPVIAKPVGRAHVRNAVAMGLGFQNPSQEFWWKGLAPIVEKLMVKAEYPDYIQYSYLTFIAKFILPSLGLHGGKQAVLPKITHDRSPLEPSLNISKSGLSVRFTLEPRGPFAGLPQDPFGQHEGRKLFDEIIAFSPLAASVDSKLFNHFVNELWIPNSAAAVIDLPPDRSPPQCQLAFDLHPTKALIGVKAYFIPLLKSKYIDSTPQDVAFSAIAGCDWTGGLAPSFNMLKEYMVSLPDTRKCSVQMLAVDCVEHALARIKCYAKAYQVSISNILDMYTLGGRLSSKSTIDGLAILKDILPMLLDCEGETEEAVLTRPLLAHPHGGIVGSFELLPGCLEPEVKIYIPVWAFIRNDRIMAQNLVKVFKRFGWEGEAVRYQVEFEEMFEGHDLGKSGTHTYVSFSYTEKKGNYLTLYYSPGAGMKET